MSVNGSSCLGNVWRGQGRSCNHCNHHGRHPVLAVAGTAVVIAAAFCGMCLPRNPAATTPIKPTAANTTATKMTTRLPRPISVLLTITSTDGSLSMASKPLHRLCLYGRQACREILLSAKLARLLEERLGRDGKELGRIGPKRGSVQQSRTVARRVHP